MKDKIKKNKDVLLCNLSNFERFHLVGFIYEKKYKKIVIQNGDSFRIHQQIIYNFKTVFF